MWCFFHKSFILVNLDSSWILVAVRECLISKQRTRVLLYIGLINMTKSVWKERYLLWKILNFKWYSSTVIFNIVIKAGGLACHKNRFNPPFVLKMACSKSGKLPLLYYSSFLCVVHFSVSVVSLFSSYIWCVSLSFSV